MITTDGLLIGMTYDPIENVIAWHRHPVSGKDAKVLSIAAPTSTSDDRTELYLIVSRTIDGATQIDVEYLSREFEFETTNEEAFFVDSGITQRTASFVTIKIESGNLTAGDTIRFNDTSLVPLFTNIDLVAGTDFAIGGSPSATATNLEAAIDGHVTLSKFMSAATVTDTVTVTDLTTGTRSTKWTVEDTVDVGPEITLGNIDPDNFWLSTKVITGLGHLEGEEVCILANGAPRPNQTVSGAEITLASDANIAHVGLCITSFIKPRSGSP